MTEFKLRIGGVDIEGLADSSTIRMDRRLPGVPAEALKQPHALYRFDMPDGDTAWLSLIKAPDTGD